MADKKVKNILVKDIPFELHKKMRYYMVDNDIPTIRECMIKFIKEGVKNGKKSKSS